MPKRTALVDYDKCKPNECAPDDGLCPAARACTHGIMIQEAAYEEPMVFPPNMCQGCGDCARACPLDAMRMM